MKCDYRVTAPCSRFAAGAIKKNILKHVLFCCCLTTYLVCYIGKLNNIYCRGFIKMIFIQFLVHMP